MIRRLTILSIVTIVTVAILLSGVADAQSASFSFATDPNVGISGAPGTLGHLAGITTPAEMVGLDCAVILDVANNESTRAGTGLVVSSNGVRLTKNGVEDKPGNAPPENIGHLVLGPYVNAWVLFGPAGVASVDGAVHVECADVPPTTGPTTGPTTVTVPPTANRAERATASAPTAVLATPAVTG